MLLASFTLSAFDHLQYPKLEHTASDQWSKPRAGNGLGKLLTWCIEMDAVQTHWIKYRHKDLCGYTLLCYSSLFLPPVVFRIITALPHACIYILNTTTFCWKTHCKQNNTNLFHTKLTAMNGEQPYLKHFSPLQFTTQYKHNTPLWLIRTFIISHFDPGI